MRRASVLICALMVPLRLGAEGGPALTVIDPDTIGPEVSFESVLTGPDPAISGQSLASLVKRQPLFPPIDDLPDEVWQNRDCSGCHHWDRTTLCTQGRFYLGDNAEESLAKAHPYGGGFKATLRRWAAQGCR